MTIALKIILIITGIVISATVLLQTSKQDNNQLIGIGDPFAVNKRGPIETLYHKITMVCAVLFLLTGIVLMIIGG